MRRRACRFHKEAYPSFPRPRIDSYREFLDKQPVYFFGNGAAKCKEVIKHPNARFVDDIEPLARWMFPLADREYMNESFQDVAYFEPFYLKEFVATVAKNKVF